LFDVVTQLSPSALPGQGYFFVAKAVAPPSIPKGDGPFTQLQNGLPGKRYNFTAKAVNVLINTSQQICINGELVAIKQMNARMDAQKALNAGFIDRIPLVGETITIKSANGEINTVIVMTGIIEECN